MKTDTKTLGYFGEAKFDAKNTIVPITNWDSKVEIDLMDLKGEKLLMKIATMSKFCPKGSEN